MMPYQQYGYIFSTVLVSAPNHAEMTYSAGFAVMWEGSSCPGINHWLKVEPVLAYGRIARLWEARLIDAWLWPHPALSSHSLSHTFRFPFNSGAFFPHQLNASLHCTNRPSNRATEPQRELLQSCQCSHGIHTSPPRPSYLHRSLVAKLDEPLPPARLPRSFCVPGPHGTRPRVGSPKALCCLRDHPDVPVAFRQKWSVSLQRRRHPGSPCRPSRQLGRPRFRLSLDISPVNAAHSRRDGRSSPHCQAPPPEHLKFAGCSSRTFQGVWQPRRLLCFLCLFPHSQSGEQWGKPARKYHTTDNCPTPAPDRAFILQHHSWLLFSTSQAG